MHIATTIIIKMMMIIIYNKKNNNNNTKNNNNNHKEEEKFAIMILIRPFSFRSFFANFVPLPRRPSILVLHLYPRLLLDLHGAWLWLDLHSPEDSHEEAAGPVFGEAAQ